MDRPPFMIAPDHPGHADWFSTFYQAIDGVLDGRGGNVPPGTLATLYRALDGLRDVGGHDAHVSRGGAMVVTLHRLQAMLRQSADPGATLPLRRDLARMQREWLATAPILH